MGGAESLGHLTRVLVHCYAHILGSEVDVSRHGVSVASIELQKPAPDDSAESHLDFHRSIIAGGRSAHLCLRLSGKDLCAVGVGCS
jgi:hypothetical protein